MEEKVIIKSVRTRFKPLYFVLIAAGVLVLGLLLYVFNVGGARVPAYRSWESYSIFQLMFDPFSSLSGLLIDIGIILLLVAVFITWMLSSNELTVTNMRVYGKAHFGKRVDLPFDMISAVGTSSVFNGLTVSTASGVIKFSFLENRNELHEAISKLLVERQSKEKPATVTTIKQEIPQSDADELKKYKDLLDTGVITQEEFDAKKKQILGL